MTLPIKPPIGPIGHLSAAQATAARHAATQSATQVLVNAAAIPPTHQMSAAMTTSLHSAMLARIQAQSLDAMAVRSAAGFANRDGALIAAAQLNRSRADEHQRLRAMEREDALVTSLILRGRPPG